MYDNMKGSKTDNLKGKIKKMNNDKQLMRIVLKTMLIWGK
jgi:hypothetical protein